MLRRHNTGYRDGDYNLVAGHLEPNEMITTGAVREAKEEIDVDVAPSSLRLVHVLHHRSNDDRLALFLEAASWRGTPRIAEPSKCDSIEWFSPHALPPNTVPYVRHALAEIAAARLYSEFGW